MLVFKGFHRAALIVGAMLLLGLSGAHGQTALKLAVVSSISGVFEVSYGRPFLDGVRLAVEEANAAGPGPRILLDIHDDRGTEEGARAAAERIGASDALAVVGPPLSTSSIAAGPAFARAGIASIVTTVESDLVTDHATTFRASFKNSDLGASLANYLRHALGGTRAAVIFADNAYGRTIADGFRRSASRLGLATSFHAYATPAERDEAVRRVAADPDRPAIVLGMLDDDAVPVMVTLRRQGATAPVLGPTGMGNESFADKFKDLPEEQRARGFFTRGVYAAVPVILDSANSETLAFAERFHVRLKEAVHWAAHAATWQRPRTEGSEPWPFITVNGAKLRAVAGLLGPLWFTPDRGRDLPIRVGHFNKGLFESAPLQLVPVANPAAADIASGALVEVGAGQYARRQQVVYTGIYLNEIPRLDVAQSIFTADLYVWIRFARGVGTAEADPTQFEFPDLVRGSFDPTQPTAQRDLEDGTTYRLWRLHGDFKNDYDLHRYPADLQRLGVRFFNAHAATDRLVYVLDRSSLDPAPGAIPSKGGDTDAFSGAEPAAFRNLTQWLPVRVGQGRDNLVIESSLGDPGQVGIGRRQELSGFEMVVEVRRRIGTTLVKTVLPIGLMTLIMFATFYFPPALAGAKVTVAITAGLSGAVLLSSINAQLGNVGYVIAVEYGFYVFFALCLLCIVTVLLVEKLRLAERAADALKVERVGRYVFVFGFAATIVAALVVL
ncbi:MAG: ABC transporter substrate-binding protein [Alphaproteobacteria bacterium]|nr:ABC transporter substrate-binding protein [Alphaproteobacteria bacterium]